MATYTEISLGSGWTGPQLLDALKQSFIAAGWMTDWYDTYIASGASVGVLKFTYGTTETYKDIYYRFRVDTGAIAVTMGGNWNSTTKQYEGVLYLDYFEAIPNESWNVVHGGSVSNATAFTFYACRSEIDPSFGFVESTIFTSTLSSCFFFVTPEATIAPWIDLDKYHINGMFNLIGATSGTCPMISVRNNLKLRRSVLFGDGLRLSTDRNTFHRQTKVMFDVYSTSSSSSVSSNWNPTGVFVPVSYAPANPALSASESFILNGFPMSPLSTDVLPSDLGFFATYDTQGYLRGDTLIVSAGTNEWKVITPVYQPDIDRSSMYLVARTV